VYLTASEIDSLQKILRAVYLSDWGSQIVADAHAILAKLSDPDLAEYIALGVPMPCRRCGRAQRSRSMGCPDACKCQHCHGRKCKGECK
jgi:hypothetical protein